MHAAYPEYSVFPACEGLRAIVRVFAQITRMIWTGPLALRRASGDPEHVSARLMQQRAAMVEPFTNSAGAGIVGRGHAAEVPETIAQRPQEARGCLDSLLGIERISQPHFGGYFRPELCDAQRPGAAHRISLQLAFLPDQVGEERHGRA